MSVNFRFVTFNSNELTPGFKGDHCCFEHKDFCDRTPYAQTAYRRLEKSLLENGMTSPLIVYQNHVIVGMRRFEILRDKQQSFECIEVMEDLQTGGAEWVDRINSFAKAIYPDIDKYRSTPA